MDVIVLEKLKVKDLKNLTDEQVKSCILKEHKIVESHDILRQIDSKEMLSNNQPLIYEINIRNFV